MALKIVGIHHHGIRVGDNGEPLDDVFDFYTNVLGMDYDKSRPQIIPGWWMNTGSTGQIHLMGGPYPSPVSKGPGKDPCDPHVALAVESMDDTIAELDRMGVPYYKSVAGDTKQVFVHDPCGNMIELHQVDQCRCTARGRGEGE
ncbi:VOC family protein [Emcibacter nanhaiensis]|uniref:Glyoxalase n=1 Tax=Emcibacter nanhaiensis TaxID=1505037 RepID=A0A501PU09_9PROT|nr:VOC family protein [Emcibacter nanhaiensis]TPD63211.1 glyoxalase [Emcibacter nanhaiensis]